MEILRFHLEYNTFPSEYIGDCVVTPLIHQKDTQTAIPESAIPDLDLRYNSDIEEELPLPKLRNKYRSKKPKQLNMMRSG